MSWFTRFRNVFRSGQVADDIEREMAFHLAERADELRAGGMPSDAAKREARRRFGNVARLREDTRDRNLLVWLDTLLADLRYAVRFLRATPGFTMVAILSLALGIGANTVVFTLINVMTLKALPVADPDGLMLLTVSAVDAKTPATFTGAVWERLRDHQDIFSEVAVYGATGSGDLSTGGETRRVTIGLVSGRFFATLGVRAALGRTLMDADDRRDCPAVAVITDRFWKREFGGRPDVIGRSVPVNGRPFDIVGVTEPAFFGVEYGAELPIWAAQCAGALIRGAGAYSAGGWIFGRLKPGVSLEQSRARLAALSPHIMQGAGGPTSPVDAALGIVPFSKGLPDLRRRYGEALAILLAITGVVLLVACANIANLLLARATVRRREMAIRVAIGAGRARLIRQLLTESLLLALIGAAGGVLLAYWGSRGLVDLLSNAISLDVTPDATVLGFTIAVASLTGILFGLAPAFRAARLDPHAVMMPAAAVEGCSRFRIGKALVVAQLALSMMMVATAGLLVGSWGRLLSIDTGFRSDGVLLVAVNSAAARLSVDQRRETNRAMLERLRALPGVADASAAWITPFGQNARVVVRAAGDAPLDAIDTEVRLNQVSDRYFRTIGTMMLVGRDFAAQDLPGSTAVAIVNEECARRLYGQTNAVGRRFRVRQRTGLLEPIEIVGVVANTKWRSLREATEPIVYYPLDQASPSEASLNFAVRTAGSTSVLAPAVKAALVDINPRLSLTLTTLTERVRESIRLPYTLATLSGVFGVLALLLATIGLYGIVSYTVGRRRGELSLRIALGAPRHRIIGLVVGETGWLVAAGVALGVGLSLSVVRVISSFLYGVTPRDPATFALSALALTLVGMGAALIPARRAARMDPLAALRQN